MKEPIGLLGSLSPARDLIIVSLIDFIASSWPNTLSLRCDSSWSILSLSVSNIFDTGIPVHFPTTSAISSLVSSCFNNLFLCDPSFWLFASLSSSSCFCFSSVASLPYFSSASLFKS